MENAVVWPRMLVFLCVLFAPSVRALPIATSTTVALLQQPIPLDRSAMLSAQNGLESGWSLSDAVRAQERAAAAIGARRSGEPPLSLRLEQERFWQQLDAWCGKTSIVEPKPSQKSEWIDTSNGPPRSADRVAMP
jgi:hypothetical protein